jgi:hypothetical protein
LLAGWYKASQFVGLTSFALIVDSD